jgi:hypothetical protein
MLLKGPEWTWSFADSASNPATDVGCPIFFTSEILVSRNGRSRDNLRTAIAARFSDGILIAIPFSTPRTMKFASA